MSIAIQKASMLSALVAICLLGTCSVQADSVQPSIISVEMTLVSNSTLALCEPIVLHYKIINNSEQIANVNMGLDGAMGGTEWLTKKLVSANGQAVPSIDAPVSHLPSGGDHVNSVILSPKSASQGYLIANRWFVIAKAGQYTLSVSVRLPCRIGEDYVDGPTPQQIVVTQDYVFPLTVTPANPSRLQATAETLRQAAAEEKDSLKQEALVQAIFSMPEKQVAQVWEEMAQEPQLYHTSIVSELGRLHSAKAADILAAMIWNPSPSAASASTALAIAQLEKMYTTTSDAALKQHIQFIYDRHGIRQPKEHIHPISG